jgi:hypothetical protein
MILVLHIALLTPYAAAGEQLSCFTSSMHILCSHLSGLDAATNVPTAAAAAAAAPAWSPAKGAQSGAAPTPEVCLLDFLLLGLCGLLAPDECSLLPPGAPCSSFCMHTHTALT